MNLREPFTNAFKNPDGSNSILVNWIDHRSPFADFITEFWQTGPFEETHPRVRAVQPFVIYKSSEMEN